MPAIDRAATAARRPRPSRRRLRRPPHRPRRATSRPQMLARARATASLDDADRRRRARRRSGRTSRSTCPRRSTEADGARRAARPGRPQPSRHVAHRHGLLRHLTPPVILPQRAREPRLVHGVHALPARDLPGPARGAAQLPDDGRRPHRHGPRQRLACSTRRTAAAEAMTHGRRRRRRRGDAFFVDADCHPQTIAVVATRAEPLGIERAWSATSTDARPRRRASACSSSTRARSGAVRDLRALIERGARARRARGRRHRPARPACCCAPPGESGADVVVGSAQRFGVPLGFGGPHAGFMAVRDGCTRVAARPPGRRLASTPTVGPRCGSRCRPASSTSAARRPPSNICTAQVLLAIMAGDVRRVPRPRRPAPHRRACPPADRDPRRRPARRRRRGRPRRALRHGHGRACPAGPTRSSPPRSPGINLRLVDDDTVGVASTRPRTARPSSRVLAAFGVDRRCRRRRARRGTSDALPAALRRTSRSSPTRCSTATAPRPRCCATCAAWPTRTWRSTGR